MEEKIVKNALVFLERVNLTGKETQAFNEVIKWLLSFIGKEEEKEESKKKK